MKHLFRVTTWQWTSGQVVHTCKSLSEYNSAMTKGHWHSVLQNHVSGLCHSVAERLVTGRWAQQENGNHYQILQDTVCKLSNSINCVENAIQTSQARKSFVGHWSLTQIQYLQLWHVLREQLQSMVSKLQSTHTATNQYIKITSTTRCLSSLVVSVDLQLDGCKFNSWQRHCRVTTLGKLFTPTCLSRSQWFSSRMTDCSVRGHGQLCLSRHPQRCTALGTGCPPFLQWLGQLSLPLSAAW